MSATLDVVRGVIDEVLGPEWSADREIGMETSFGNDLELESIEFVALAEKLQARYEKVDFVRWLSEKELEEIIELKVGDLVTYIDTCR
ncbi:MAG TPA: acyl carrier protein [Gemmatimonadota bacterium]|nr:acyl carrier protein [Gemmatimonadota bacterium]